LPNYVLSTLWYTFNYTFNATVFILTRSIACKAFIYKNMKQYEDWIDCSSSIRLAATMLAAHKCKTYADIVIVMYILIRRTLSVSFPFFTLWSWSCFCNNTVTSHILSIHVLPFIVSTFTYLHFSMVSLFSLKC